MRIAKLALLLTLAACGGEDPTSSRGVRLLPEQTRVPRDPATGQALVQLRLVNTGGETRYVPACGHNPSVAVERLRAGAWESYAAGICIAVLPMDPIALEGGAELSFAVTVREAGVYRARGSVYAAPDGSGARALTSATVEVR